MTNTCPACGQSSSGRFCSQCGVNLESPHRCAQCDHELSPGGRFCNMCGSPTTLSAASAHNQPEPEARGSASSLPWIITAGVLVALVAMLLVPRFRGQGPEGGEEVVSGPPITGTPGDPSSVDLASMSPREAADRLFNRVMQGISSGDTAQARQFLPMALMAYQRVPELDADGRYHLALLQLVGGDPQSARAQADTILSTAPNHLYGLFTAGQAEAAMGNEAEARELFQRFLQNYEAEVASDRPEYQEHSRILPTMREEAQKVVDGA